MVWMLLGALANSIVPEFGLSDSQKGLMVAVPLLGGAVLRLVLGLLTDRIGARRHRHPRHDLDGHPARHGLALGRSFTKVLLVGLLLGVAGASFAAALPLASRWYPPQYQGLAMGIAGAGNSGTALATFFGPRLAQAWGWHAGFRPGADTAAGDARRVLCLRQGQPPTSRRHDPWPTTPACSGSATPGGSACSTRSPSAASWGWPAS